MKAPRLNWYLIVNDDACVLAVYGSALGDDAEAKARELAAIGPVALRMVATCKRPHVGDRLSQPSIRIHFEGGPA